MSAVNELRATRVSIILGAILVALIVGLIGSGLFAGAMLVQKSTVATHAQIDAQVSAGYSGQIEALKQYLAAHADIINQTAALTSSLGTNDQNSIIATVNNYAGKAGVSITGLSFGNGAPAPGAPATPAPAGAASANSINLSLASPLPYRNFLIFLRLLEQGQMPVQITNAQISPDTQTPDMVIVPTITIQVGQ